jgi:hypothetical protein
MNESTNTNMTITDLLAFHEAICSEGCDLMERKNHDYCGSQVITASEVRTRDPFANFRRAEQLGITTTSKAILTRMLDKFLRLATATTDKDGVDSDRLRVTDETFKDTCVDLINYTVILLAWQTQQNQAKEEPLPQPVANESVIWTRDQALSLCPNRVSENWDVKFPTDVDFHPYGPMHPYVANCPSGTLFRVAAHIKL